jgi:hypothetical protein
MVDSSSEANDSINKHGIDISDAGVANGKIYSVRWVTWNDVFKRLAAGISELSGLPVSPIVFTIIDKLVDGSGIDNRESKDSRSTNKDALHQLAVVNLYYREEAKKCRLIIVSCGVSALSVGVLNHFAPTLMPAANKVILALSALALLARVRLMVIAYRIAKGYFGNNRSELTSFVSFIIDKSDDIDSSGGDQFKLVYPQTDQSQENQVIEGLEGLGA